MATVTGHLDGMMLQREMVRGNIQKKFEECDKVLLIEDPKNKVEITWIEEQINDKAKRLYILYTNIKELMFQEELEIEERGASVFILVAEVIWVVTLFLQLSYRPDHRIWKIWSAVTWFEDWKKSIVYGPMGIVPLIWPHKLWLSYVAGGQLIALAVFHFALTFKGWKRRKRKERLIPGEIDSFESSKFEEVTEVLDDCLPEPIPGSSHSLSDSLAEQSTVVEI